MLICTLIRTWKSRIRACVLGREAIYGHSDIVIIARTDALAVEGFDSALQRVHVISFALFELLNADFAAAPCRQRVRCRHGLFGSH